MIAIQQNIGEMQIRTDFVNKFMSQSEDGLVIGQKMERQALELIMIASVFTQVVRK